MVNDLLLDLWVSTKVCGLNTEKERLHGVHWENIDSKLHWGLCGTLATLW